MPSVLIAQLECTSIANTNKMKDALRVVVTSVLERFLWRCTNESDFFAYIDCGILTEMRYFIRGLELLSIDALPCFGDCFRIVKRYIHVDQSRLYRVLCVKLIMSLSS